MQEKPILAIIGGSGLYNMPGLESTTQVELDTPFGRPSSPIVQGILNGKPIAFLARHGLGHTLSPSEVNYRANIYALKSLGATRILSVSACGSLREDFAPGEVVIPNQLFDFTRGRKRSFFGNGLVAHISVAEPFCPALSQALGQAVKSVQGVVHQGGNFITIEGPRFSTRVESNTFRSWGMSIIGMTTSPEAFLAREAEMCYAVMAHVTDYDVWHITEEAVTVDMVIRTLMANTKLAHETIRKLVNALPEADACNCRTALDGALITDLQNVDRNTIDKLGLLIERFEI